MLLPIYDEQGKLTGYVRPRRLLEVELNTSQRASFRVGSVLRVVHAEGVIDGTGWVTFEVLDEPGEAG